jgi:hypothetical protein
MAYIVVNGKLVKKSRKTDATRFFQKHRPIINRVGNHVFGMDTRAVSNDNSKIDDIINSNDTFEYTYTIEGGNR